MATFGGRSVKQIVLDRLQDRNRRQSEGYASLIQAHNLLFESVDVIKSKNVQLTVETERLKQENLTLQVQVQTGAGAKAEKGQEGRLLKVQEELTELHRKKGEHAQQIIDLNTTLQEKEKELQAKDATIKELESNITALRSANQNLEQSVQEYSTTNQMLTDEQQALQLAFTSLEEKFRKIQEDNNDLVSRWMSLKSQAADRMNADNERVKHAHQLRVQAKLMEAANDKVNIAPSSGPMMCPTVLPVCVTVPSKALSTFDAHEGEVNAVRWSPSGRMFATGGADRKLKLWEVVGGKCESKGFLTGSNAAIMSIEYNLEESYILAASNDFASRVWTISDQRLRMGDMPVVHTLTGHSGKVLAAKFLGDPNKVVSGSHDRTLKIWDLRSKACIKTIFAGSSCNDIATSDSLGTNMISGHFDKKIRFWDTRSDSSANEILLQGRITSLDLAPDGNSLLSCSRDDALKLIDLRMNKVMDTLGAEGFHVGCDWSRAVFSPDGEYVMAGSQNGGVFVWNINKHKLEKVLTEHNNSVIACSWNPTGSSLLSCDRQRKVVLWSDF